MKTETKFMTFWRIVNDIRAEQGLPALAFGPAHDEWVTLQRAIWLAAR